MVQINRVNGMPKKSMDILLIRYKQTDNLFKALLSGYTFGHLPGGSARIFDKAKIPLKACHSGFLVQFSFSGNRNQLFCFIEGFEKIVFFPFTAFLLVGFYLFPVDQNAVEASLIL